MVDYNKYFAAFDGVQDGIAKTWASFIYAMSMLLMFVSKPIDIVLNAIAEVQGGAEIGGIAIVDLSWVFKLVFSVFGFLFVFSTDSTDTVITQSGPENFGLHVLLARATIFFSSLMAAFIGVSDILVKVSTRVPFGVHFCLYSWCYISDYYFCCVSLGGGSVSSCSVCKRDYA